MGWETRGNGQYYYKKEWINGRCVSTYFGGGEVVHLVDQLESGERIKARRARAKEKRRRAEFESLDKQIDEMVEINKIIVDTLYLISGYHQHKRQWRKKRKAKQ